MMGITFSSNFDETHLTPWLGTFKNVGKGSHGYERRAISEMGAVIISDGPVRMGKNLLVTGACFQAMRDADLAVDEFPEFCIEHEGRATRLDLCVNLHDAYTDVDTLYELASLGQIRSRASLDKRIKSPHDNGFYVGSKKSDQFMRVYDKRLEQATPTAQTWIRLELQMRKRYAVSITASYSQSPDKRAFINKVVRHYCDFPTSGEVQEALAVQDGDIPLLHRKPPKFIQWMNNQIVPAMLNYQAQHPEIDVLHILSRLYHEAAIARKGQ